MAKSMEKLKEAYKKHAEDLKSRSPAQRDAEQKQADRYKELGRAPLLGSKDFPMAKNGKMPKK